MTAPKIDFLWFVDKRCVKPAPKGDEGDTGFEYLKDLGLSRLQEPKYTVLVGYRSLNDPPLKYVFGIDRKRKLYYVCLEPFQVNHNAVFNECKVTLGLTGVQKA